MKFVRTIIIAIAALMTLACTPAKEELARDLVTRFYKMHQTLKPAGALSLQELIAVREYLSVPLFDLVKDVSVAEEAHLANPDEPALVQGDLLSANPKGLTGFKILACELKDDNAGCAVELTWNDGKSTPIKWTDRLLLGRDARGWVIDDIEFGGAAAPMRHGNLKATLQAILDQLRQPAVPKA